MLFRNNQNKPPVKSRVLNFIHNFLIKYLHTSKLLLYFAS